MKCTDHIIYSLTFISADRPNFEKKTKTKRRNPGSVSPFIKKCFIEIETPTFSPSPTAVDADGVPVCPFTSRLTPGKSTGGKGIYLFKTCLDIFRALDYPNLSFPNSKSAKGVLINTYYIVDSGNCFSYDRMHFFTAPRPLGEVLGCALYLC